MNSKTGTVFPERYFTRMGAHSESSLLNEIAQEIGNPHTYEVRWM